MSITRDAVLDALKTLKDPVSGSDIVAAGIIRALTIEGSNVNAVGALVNMIELQRKYEMQVKMMSTAEENSAASARMLQLNG